MLDILLVAIIFIALIAATFYFLVSLEGYIKYAIYSFSLFILSIFGITWLYFASCLPWDYIETPAKIIKSNVPNGTAYSVGYYDGKHAYHIMELTYAPTENKSYVVKCPNTYKIYGGIYFIDHEFSEKRLTHLEEVSLEK